MGWGYNKSGMRINIFDTVIQGGACLVACLPSTWNTRFTLHPPLGIDY